MAPRSTATFAPICALAMPAALPVSDLARAMARCFMEGVCVGIEICEPSCARVLALGSLRLADCRGLPIAACSRGGEFPCWVPLRTHGQQLQFACRAPA